jgi:ecotin
LPPSREPAISPNPADWRVQLLVGRTLAVDCNRHRLSGVLQPEVVPGWGTTVYRVVGAGPAISTRMVCPPGEGPRQEFVSLAGEPLLVPYNESLPIVVYAPRDLQVRWRLWKAERQLHDANRQ